MSLKIRSVVHFLWLKDILNAEISREMDSVYGEGVVRLRASESGRIVWRTAITVSKTGRGLIVFDQPNM
jgi:hypothetical protein